MNMRTRATIAGSLLAAGGIIGGGAYAATTPPPGLPWTDVLRNLAQYGASQMAAETPPVYVPGPTLHPVPTARCDTASRPLREAMQGRVSAADIASPGGKTGWACNVTQVSHVATPGGFRTWRYTDRSGHTCAFYDTSLAAPLTIFSPLAGPSLGTAVVDITNPSRPVQTAMLTSLAMLSPHESLNLNTPRGLLAAEVGNAATLPGTMDIYTVAADCRHPKMLSEVPIAMGHESGFSPDGRTFWIGTATSYIYAYDVSNPAHPAILWTGAYYAHGLSFAPDGKTMYQTDPVNGNIAILDVSQIQDRVAHPVVKEFKRITWPTVSIPQNSQYFTNNGHRYLLEFDEFAFRINPPTMAETPGAARIINIDHPGGPRIVSDLRLQVQMPANHKIANADPYPLASVSVVGYGSHYCSVPTTNTPQLAACSDLNSGLRVFNISNPAAPYEVAYFINPPRVANLLPSLQGVVAFSMPTWDVVRHQVIYTDAVGGMYVLQLHSNVWK